MGENSYIPFSNTMIIAEIGLSHDGSLGNAINLAIESIKNGADIIKFQVHYPEEESSVNEKFRINFSYQDKSRWEYWKRTSFNFNQWKIIKTEVEKSGGIFGASVFSSYALNMMLDLNIKVLKLGSGDIANEELLDELSSFNETLILSTGMSSMAEISHAVNWLNSSLCNTNSAILQCTSLYPTPFEKVGLNIMLEIIRKFGIKSGLSDHSQGISASIAAATLGASYIEKHVVYSKNMFGPDATSSIEFHELRMLRQYIDDLRKLSTLVDKDFEISHLNDMRITFGRSLALKKSMKKGTVPQIKDFCLRKPAGGLKWQNRFDFEGLPLKSDYTIGEILTLEHFK